MDPELFILLVISPLNDTILRYLVEWLSYWISRALRRIQQESQATFQNPSIQLRPMSPVILILAVCVKEMYNGNTVFPQG